MEEVGIRLSLAGRREAAAGLKETSEGLEGVGDSAEVAAKKSSRAAATFKKVGGILGGMVKGGILAAVATGVGVIGVALQKGFTRLTGIENATAKLTGLGHTSKSVTRIMDNALASVRGTAFGMDEAATTAAGAVAAGVKPGKDLERTLKLVADAATIGGSSMGEMGSIFNKVATSNKVQADVMNQLSDRGIPIVQLLAKELGVTTDQVLEMSKEGKIGFGTFQKAMETGMGGAALKSGSTTTGALKNVGAALGRLGAGMMSGSFPMIKKLAKQAIIVIDGLTERLAPLMDRMNASLGPKMAAGLKGSGNRILDSIDRISASVGGLIDTYKTGGLKGLFASFKTPEIPKISKGTATSLSGIGASFGEIGDAVKDVDWDQVKANLGEGAADTVSVFSVAIGFAADNVDTLARYLPQLVTAYAAFKVAQAAANAAALLSIPIQVVQISSQVAHTVALRSNTAAMATGTAVEKTSRISKVAHTAATVAQAGATKALAIGQRILNVVMRANPIGLLITGLVLAAGAVYALYQKSETFRGIVDGLWNNVLKPFGEWIGDKLVGFILDLGAAFLRMAAFGVKAWGFLVKAAIWAFDGILWAAEKGLGWVPGLGDKIKGARASFDEFGDKTIAKLGKVEARLRTTADAIDQVAKNRTATIDITTRYTTLGNPTRGRPDEYGSPTVGGTGGSGGGGGKQPSSPRITIPKIPSASAASDRGYKPERMPNLQTNLYLDGKKVAASTAKHLGDAVARR